MHTTNASTTLSKDCGPKDVNHVYTRGHIHTLDARLTSYILVDVDQGRQPRVHMLTGRQPRVHSMPGNLILPDNLMVCTRPVSMSSLFFLVDMSSLLFFIIP